MFSHNIFERCLAEILDPVRENLIALTVCDPTQPGLPILSVNDSFTELTGYSRGQVVGRDMSFLQGPLTDVDAARRLRNACMDGSHAFETLNIYRRNGSYFLDEVEVSPIHDESGSLRLLSVIHREASANIDAEQALARRVRFILRPGSAPVSVDVPGSSQQDWLDRVSDADKARLAHAARCCADCERNLLITLRLANPAGLESEMMLRARRVAAPSQPEEIVFEGSLVPQSGALLLGSRLRLLEAMMANVKDVIIVTDAEPFEAPGPRILYVNDAITLHTGYRPEQLVGRTPRILGGALTDRDEIARFGAALRRWEPVTATLLNYRSDGSTFWNEMSCTPIADEFGWYTHWISIERDITERRAFTEKVEFLADHDPLTGLANRRLANADLVKGLSRAAEDNSYCGVLKLDLDRFKAVNDAYGHAAGDAVLSEVASRLTGAACGGDTVARIGGDEFIVVVPGLADRDDLQLAAARFLAHVNGPFRWSGRKLSIKASLGAAMFPQDADDPDGLMAAADIALYQAKAVGRGCAHGFSENMRAKTSEMRHIGEELYDAIERDEFEAFFQPKARLSDHRLVGFEALVRWRHPRRGLLSPLSFLSIADASGLTRAIDESVARQVVGQAARWTAAGLDFGCIAINVSADSFADPCHAANLAGTLSQAGVDPHRLVVEILESIFMNDSGGNVVGRLAELRRLGIQVELDDFGTGYAALAHLRAFKVDGIKLDRSFVAGIGTDREDEIICAAIVGLARSLGIRCVAEGIETELQCNFLRDLGCDNGQGYLFGKPAGQADTSVWLRRLSETGMVVPIGTCLRSATDVFAPAA